MKAADLTSEQRRDEIIAAAEDKKANYITQMDLRGKTIVADFFIICSGTSNIHIRAIADGIMEALEKHGIRRRRIEGYSEASWVLLDYGDSIVHIMSEDQRDYYKLEALWTGEAPAARPAAIDRAAEESDNDEVSDDDEDVDDDHDYEVE